MSSANEPPRPESADDGSNATGPISADASPAAPSYVNLAALLSPGFDPHCYANSLVLATSNPDDPPPLDLSTPLSRVLFDAQEVDSHIDSLTARHAVPLLTHTRDRAAASKRIVDTLGGHVEALGNSYRQLEKDVVGRHAEADEVRNVTSRVLEALWLARTVGRCLNLGRQLEVQFSELGRKAPRERENERGGRDAEIKDGARDINSDHEARAHGALVRCAHTILSLREMLEKTAPGQEGHQLRRVDAVRQLSDAIIWPTERAVRESAERVIREFSVSAAATFTQGEDARSRTVSALLALYLLSPTAGVRADRWTPSLLVAALESYVRTAVQSSAAGLARGLGQLPFLERALGEVVGRCQNVVALEMVLESTRPPSHPLYPPLLPPIPPALLSPPDAHAATDDVDDAAFAEKTMTASKAIKDSKKGKVHVHTPPPNLLQPLLSHLETGSLASYFWRSMAGGVSTRVQELMARGGVASRTLRTNKAGVGDSIRDAVKKGSALPPSLAGRRHGQQAHPGGGEGKAAGGDGKWEMETAVMVGSVLNNLGGR